MENRFSDGVPGPDRDLRTIKPLTPTIIPGLTFHVMTSSLDMQAWLAQTDGYVNWIMAAVIVYDYLLNIGQEIDFIWCHESSSKAFKAIYGILRYSGLVFIVFFQSNKLLVVTYAGCYAYLVMDNVTATVIVATVQGMMAMRVYAMSRRCKTAFIVLSVGFVLAQVENVISTMVAVFPAEFEKNSSSPESNTGSCGPDLSPSRTWLNVSGNFVWAIYELVLVTMALYYFRKDLQEAQCRSIASFMNVLLRDHIIYFVLSFLAMVFSAIPDALQSATSTQSNPGETLTLCTMIGGMLFITQTCMAGPLMMLSIRRYEARTIDGLAYDGMETIRFAMPSGEAEMQLDTP